VEATPQLRGFGAGDDGEGAEGSAEVDGQDTPAEGDDAGCAASEVGTALASDAGAEASSSNVSCVTADFAMQNVLLQMGLRVVAPNGLAIRRLSRHVLRCSACFLVTKVRGTLFIWKNPTNLSICFWYTCRGTPVPGHKRHFRGLI